MLGTPLNRCRDSRCAEEWPGGSVGHILLGVDDRDYEGQEIGIDVAGKLPLRVSIVDCRMADCERSNSHGHDDVSSRAVRRFPVRAGAHLADPWHAPHNGASIIVAPSAADCAWTVVGLVSICRGAARDNDCRRIDRARSDRGGVAIPGCFPTGDTLANHEK